jgi:lipoate-protein ligase A
MILIHQPETDPFFNLAAEEFLLKYSPDNLIMLWQSNPSVIVGKHQNTFAEVNLDFVNKNHIPVIRRMSGGGTVYHDLGNINFTMITSETDTEKLIDFRKFTEPIILFLKKLGVEATFEGKNNLKVNGKKISGNSAHVMKNKILHHGTLIFDTNLKNLENAIKAPKTNITDKAVKSVRTTVTSISREVNGKMSKEEFMFILRRFLVNYFKVQVIYNLSDIEKLAIEKIAHAKYRKWEWNYAYSPAYQIAKEVIINHKPIKICFQVKSGLIEDLEISFYENEKLSNKIIKNLSGIRHDKETISQKLNEINYIFVKNNLPVNEIINLFF